MTKEDSYYAEYIQIRNQFRQYSPYLLVRAIMEFLYEDYYPISEKQFQKYPWAQILLIKWILIDKRPPKTNSNPKKVAKNSGMKVPTKQDVILLANKMLELQNQCKNISDYTHYHIFFRSISFQQFHYQHPFNAVHLSRQIILFCDESEPFFNKHFKEKFGLSILRFLEIAFFVVSSFLKGRHIAIDRNHFDLVFKNHILDSEMDCFFKAMSVDLSGLIIYLNDQSFDKRVSKEYFEQTPLLRYPLLKENNKYICWYPNILFRSIEHFIYDALRELDSQQFMYKFGRHFEEYVNRLLEYSGERFIREKVISNILTDGKQVDFVVYDDNSNIYIDAKAVEIVRSMRNSNDPNVIVDRMKTSIIAAIRQAHDVYSNISRLSKKIDIKSHRNEDQYLLVVTYKEMNVGHGEMLYEAYAKDKIDKIYSEFPQYNIPVKNMYFVTIEEFELLCELIHSKQTTMSSFLKSTIDTDSRPQTMKFDFSSHIRESGKVVKPPEFMRNSLNQFTDKLQKIFDPRESGKPTA